MRSTTLILVMALAVLVGCAEDENITINFPSEIPADFGVEPTGAVVPVEAETLSVVEIELSPALEALEAMAQVNCERLGCIVDLRSFEYSSRAGIPEIEVVLESVRAEREASTPYESDGAISWKLLAGEAQSLGMNTFVSESSAALGGQAMELGRVSCVHWPKPDVEVFAQVFVLHAPEHEGYVTLEIMDVD